MGKKNTRILNMFVIWFLFLFLLIVVLSVGRNIVYSTKGKSLMILNNDSFETDHFKEDPPDTLLIYHGDRDSRKGCDEMLAMLRQMKIPYDKVKTDKVDPAMLDKYKRVILAVSDHEWINPIITSLDLWVKKGGSLMFAFPPSTEREERILDLMGIKNLGDTEWSVVKGFTCVGDYMPGGNRKITITTPYESSLNAILKDGCSVYMKSTGKQVVHLVWHCKREKGDVVVDNLGFMEKAYRGFHCAAYTLMDEFTIWPVINGSTFYIDDFPSPVPPGDSYQIKQDYGMDIKDFYTQIWWRDVSNLSKKYNIPYTGMVIEVYSDQTSGALPRQTDTTRFEYFGNMLLDMGGELGVHGYNHMPLVLENFDYMDKYDSYRQWISVDEMRDSMTELFAFCHELFPDETFAVYVPPSNIISKEGRKILANDFPEIKCIASLYLPDQNDVSYATDFEITDDGLIQTPRIISGYVLDDYMRTAAMSELYLHCVNTHFQHPDDVLDVDRGTNLGWAELYSRFENYVDWLYAALPQIRSMTGSELGGAVQRYTNIHINRKRNKNTIRLKLDGFVDEAWFYLKLNGESPESIDGGSMTRVANGLYLIRAASSKLKIKVNH